ncbi:hypothetical protein [Streptomyces sp. CB01635]|uniref:hypothetical protein n=1 Tax=Streptomyces sp. NPDC000188 TaxID=3154245 RepID=UPI001F46DB54
MVHRRTGLPHAALAELYGIARSMISRAIREIRPLLAMRGFAIPDHSGVRLRTLADLFAYAEAAGIRLRIDGAETQFKCEPGVHAPPGAGPRPPAAKHPEVNHAPHHELQISHHRSFRLWAVSKCT